MATTSPGLTKEQLDLLRRRLEDERRRILRVLAAPVPVAVADEDRTEFEDSAQRATERTDQLGVADRERALLAEVDAALARLEAGTYGIGENTGAPIPFERLKAVPWARDTVDE